MHKGVIAYVIILILLIVFAYYMYVSSKSAVKPTHVVTTIPLNTSSSSTTVTTTINSSLNKVAYCLSSRPIVQLPNGNFSTGTYEDWNVTEYGFSSAPLNLTWANKKGAY